MPVKPMAEDWMSEKPIEKRQPSMSTAPARPAKTPEMAIARK